MKIFKTAEYICWQLLAAAGITSVFFAELHTAVCIFAVTLSAISLTCVGIAYNKEKWEMLIGSVINFVIAVVIAASM